jgi:choline-sulfatase
MISWVDDKLGQLMQELHRLGLAENTMVVLCSDHGEMMGEHGQWSKRLMLEWSCRIPLIIHAPGRIAAGKRIKAPVSLLDLFPTFCEIAGAKVETPLDGRSLLPLIDGREEGRNRTVIAEYLGEGTIEPIRMVRRSNQKYITVNNYAPQLYDLEKDPEETENTAGKREYADIEKDLRTRAEAGWDGNALKKEVMASQQERFIVRSTAQFGTAPNWNYASGPFRR